MPNVVLRHETDRQLRFGPPPSWGWVLVPAGAAAAYLGVRHASGPLGHALALAAGLLVVLAGVGATLWRHEVIVDLRSGSYRGRRGFLPSPYRWGGRLDDLEGLVLTRVAGPAAPSRIGRRSCAPSWVLLVEFGGGERPVSVFETRDESRARRRLGLLARKLGVTAIDRTGGREVRSPCPEPDRSTREDGTAARRFLVAPPPGSSIAWRVDAEAASVILPAPGFSAGTGLLAAVSLALLAAGTLGLLLPAARLAAALATAAGLAILAIAVAGSWARVGVRETADALYFETIGFGRTLGRRRVPKGRVEEIGFHPAPAGGAGEGREILVRTEDGSWRLGRNLGPDEQRWLCHTLGALSSR